MSFSKVDSKMRARIKTLSFKYSDKPQPELLIPIPNPNSGLGYKITTIYPEFTSLCPLAPSQPDYATITITYIPDKYIIELKSQKFYLVSYRSVEIFHEAVVGQIFKDLFIACSPKWLKVEGIFTVRGGISTTVSVDGKK